jgi:hypothetical protein
MKYIFLLFCSTFYGQLLHHDMLSAQGGSYITFKGLHINQTIGQQSVTGTSSNGIAVQQGFQQNCWASLLVENELVSSVQVYTYPNPFVSAINFQISNRLDQELTVFVFDIQGRLVFQQRKLALNGLLTIGLSTLPNATYLARLSGASVNYYIKIIKSL